MTETLQVRIERFSFTALEIAKGQFRQPIADILSPIIQVRAACSGYKANPHSLFDGQGVFGIPPVSAHKDSKLISERLPSRRGSNSGQSVQDNTEIEAVFGRYLVPDRRQILGFHLASG